MTAGCLDAEREVLGAMLTVESAIDAVLGTGLARDHFEHRDRHGIVFEMIEQLHGEGDPVDTLTVAAALEREGRLDQVGGRDALLALAASTSAPGNAANHAEIIREAARERKIHEIALQLANGGRANGAAALVEQLSVEIEESAQDQEPVEVAIVTAEEFGSVDEPGAESILGEDGETVIPEGGDVMIYGDGGASKTTLAIDGGFHLSAGDDWLGIPVPRPVRVLLIEAEGPRPLFRSKVRAKVESWKGSDLGGRLLVWETPWASFRFPGAKEIAERVGEAEIDVLIVGPLTRVGMDELGTLQQVRDFMAEVAKFREQSGRRLTVILVHHENKGGTVSGAWEGAGDTLLHATVRARGKTVLHFQKTRWSSKWHKETLELEWTDGEGFEAIEEPDRDLLAEIVPWLRANPHSTAKEIATKKVVSRADGTQTTIAGIGAQNEAVREVLNANQDVFRVRTGEDAKAVGRSPKARAWEVKNEA